jgi:putative membrane protein
VGSPGWAVPTLVGAGVLAQVAYPLVDGSARDALTVGTVVVCCAAAVTHAAVTRGVRTAALLVLVTAGGGLLVEAVGLASGVPFGRYDYAGSLGPKLLGVPLVIPLAWTMMAWPAWLVAARVARRARVLVAGWALASWDFFLDPQMVDAGHWTWSDPAPGLPGVAGVPLTNYAGWTIVAMLMMAALAAVLPAEPAGADLPMFAFYLWTYASSVLAHLAFFGLPGSALWGGLAMGVLAVPLALSLRGHARASTTEVAAR